MSKLEVDHRLRIRNALRQISNAGAKKPCVNYTQYGETEGKWRVHTDYFTSSAPVTEGTVLEDVVVTAIDRMRDDARLNAPLGITFDGEAVEQIAGPTVKSAVWDDDNIPF